MQMIITATTIMLMTATTMFINAIDLPGNTSSHMNIQMDLCENFYEHVCGNWIQENHQVSSTETHRLAYSAIAKNAKQVIHDIAKDTTLPILGELLDSCVDMNRINTLGMKPLEEDLQRIATVDTHKKLFAVAGALATTGTHTILQFDVDSSEAINRLTTTYVELTLPPVQLRSGRQSIDYYYKHLNDEYRKYIEQIMELSPDPIVSNTEVADIVISIEQDIGAIQKEYEDQVIEISIEEAFSKWPITFKAYMNGMKRKIQHTTAFLQEEEKVEVFSMDYMNRVESLMESISIDKLKVYVTFLMIHSRIHWLGDDALNIYFELFDKQIKRINKRESRKEWCIQRQIDYLPQLIGSHFYQQTIEKPDEKKRFVQMTDLIKEVMEQRISDSQWMDSTSRDKAKTKLNKVLTVIGHSDVNQEHEYPFILSRDHYATNIATILVHSFKTKMTKVGKPVDRREWTVSPQTVNAYYSSWKNNIELPVAMLQPPMFYDSTTHPALSFGAIGFLYGHELTHGFDNIGSMHDGDGKRGEWWTKWTKDEFKSHFDCMIDQYSKFRVFGTYLEIGNVNGTKTLGENIADNGGLSLAFAAYRMYMKRFKPDTQGMSAREGDKLFFIAFGQSWCSKTQDLRMKANLRSDHHAPDQWRVNGPIMNHLEFETVFNCAKGTKMNPIRKCTVW